jgi:hypothetical protein
MLNYSSNDSELESLIYGDITETSTSSEEHEDEPDSWIDPTRADD